MKVFCCRNQRSYGGGLILVAANTKEEAFLTAANDEKLSWLFYWAGDDYSWSHPDGNINHCTSDEYPFDCWFEVEHLSTDLSKPQIIVEDHYTE